MSNQIISVRIPKTLNDKLKNYAIDNHYMDVSEVVRTLLRKKAMQYRDPYSHQIKDMKNDIVKKISKISSRKRYEKVLSELESIKNDIVKKMGDNK